MRPITSLRIRARRRVHPPSRELLRAAKASLDGTHHHVSREHLHRYVAEFDFRLSTCKESDSERMQRIVGRAHGRRLTYREPTQGK